MLRKKVLGSLGAAVFVAAGLIAVAAPAQAVETITVTPGAYDPEEPWTIRIDGFPVMADGNIYVYWLNFENLRGNLKNAIPSAYRGSKLGEQTGAQCLEQTGVRFARTGGAGNPAPNGGTFIDGTKFNGCSWVDGKTFRFAYSEATGLNNSSVVEVTFPAGAFRLPAGGAGYAVHFTAGVNQEYDLDRVCIGTCPAPVTVPVDAQGGQCPRPSVSGVEGGMATAPPPCTSSGEVFLRYTTEPNGAGRPIPAGSRFEVRAALTLYAEFVALPAQPPRPVAVSQWGRVKVQWRPPARTGPVRFYEVRANVGSEVCYRQPDDPRPCFFWILSPTELYTFTVRGISVIPNLSGPTSERSNAASPLRLEMPKGTRKWEVLRGGGSSVRVVGRIEGTVPVDTAVRPYVCFPQPRGNCDWTPGVTQVRVDSKGRYEFTRQFGRDRNRQAVWIRVSGDGVRFSPIVRLAALR